MPPGVATRTRSRACSSSPVDLERIAQMFDARRRVTRVDRHQIETHAAKARQRAAREQLVRRSGQPQALARVDGFSRAAEGIARAQPHLDDAQHVVLEHEEIDFGMTETTVLSRVSSGQELSWNFR